MHDNLLIGLASIVALGIGAQCLAWLLHLPSILLLLIFGFVAEAAKERPPVRRRTLQPCR